MKRTTKHAPPAAGTFAALIAKFGPETPDMRCAYANYTSALSDAAFKGLEAAMVQYYFNIAHESEDCRSLYTWMAASWSGVDPHSLIC